MFIVQQPMTPARRWFYIVFGVISIFVAPGLVLTMHMRWGPKMVDYRESARKLEQMLDVEAHTLRMRRKGHRLGVFVTLLGLVVTAVGSFGAMTYPTPAWAIPLFSVGFVMLLFGYLFARLWYWFRAA